MAATAVGGIPEQVGDGVTGFLTPPGDGDAMAKAIITLLTEDALRMRLGHNAAEDAQRRFDLNRQVGKYLEWYQELIGKSTTTPLKRVACEESQAAVDQPQQLGRQA